MKKENIDSYGWVNGEYVDDMNDVIQPMIDALIEAKSELIHLYGILDIKGEETYNVKNINKALKKAGCDE